MVVEIHRKSEVVVDNILDCNKVECRDRNLTERERDSENV